MCTATVSFPSSAHPGIVPRVDLDLNRHHVASDKLKPVLLKANLWEGRGGGGGTATADLVLMIYNQSLMFPSLQYKTDLVHVDVSCGHVLVSS